MNISLLDWKIKCTLCVHFCGIEKVNLFSLQLLLLVSIFFVLHHKIHYKRTGKMGWILRNKAFWTVTDERIKKLSTIILFFLYNKSPDSFNQLCFENNSNQCLLYNASNYTCDRTIKKSIKLFILLGRLNYLCHY